MAVPARKTSKLRKKKRRTQQKLKQPSISLDPKTGEYHRSHHYTLTEINNRGS
ncbi:MAG: 50S ribosomal protein L32 [Liquorilactobacillus nagelii]|jgi:large subunit ribosomal protein L32|uniref:50S ribosomal protein L32 n=1 Tax=Liquorilactobacillus nagelii TaxID=82688 RepID=UPI00242B1E05|nr:50S ribosomal protein L32 [Liquorilactobacillus nagelii]MCI1634182.1 50S ribosomal protein L32 [Liquorilactobacillus nagelii]MCI1921377.1 50S ribosomal protein L32 [Liquorilactobacillus nagelii]MCI1977523.1 50S ribosomal protein L32 [Liquorilactobacillus nagelii]